MIATIFGEFLIFIKEKSVVVRWKEMEFFWWFRIGWWKSGFRFLECWFGIGWWKSGFRFLESFCDLESVGESRASGLFFFGANFSRKWSSLHSSPNSPFAYLVSHQPIIIQTFKSKEIIRSTFPRKQYENLCLQFKSHWNPLVAF